MYTYVHCMQWCSVCDAYACWILRLTTYSVPPGWCTYVVRMVYSNVMYAYVRIRIDTKVNSIVLNRSSCTLCTTFVLCIRIHTILNMHSNTVILCIQTYKHVSTCKLLVDREIEISIRIGSRLIVNHNITVLIIDMHTKKYSNTY